MSNQSKYKIFLLSLLCFVFLVGVTILFDSRRKTTLNQPIGISGVGGDDNAKVMADFVRASGKCAQCHATVNSTVVEEFSHSKHAQVGVSCYDCHGVVKGQKGVEHSGFTISEEVTSLSCKQCHSTQYQQFVRSRHGAPAWAAVAGRDDFTKEQIEFAEKYHKGTVDRNPNTLALVEGPAATVKGCAACHNIGKPNTDGSIGKCTDCHSRHRASVSLARTPQACGQCHMGPDHSQLEIFNESKHGTMFAAFKDTLNLNASPKTLTTKDMSIPTCATCHMSGLEGQKFTHDVTERLSYWLFAPISKKRPNFERGQTEMKNTCLKCHTPSHVETFYEEATAVLVDVNEKIAKAKKIFDDLKAEGFLTPEGFDEEIEFLYFDLWHYYGRTAKHGAFMGGADFVQWHGNYEIAYKTIELEKLAKEIRESKAKAD